MNYTTMKNITKKNIKRKTHQNEGVPKVEKDKEKTNSIPNEAAGGISSGNIAQESKLPVMSKTEMKKFISVIANTEGLKGDYVFNGFLYFLRSVYDTINANPVEAQNLMFDLQKHVYNKLMWESYYAFRAHEKIAHIIFGKTKPYVFLDEYKEEAGAADLLETKAADIEIENTALLISNLLNNPNVPQKIRGGLINALDDTDSVDTSEIDVFCKSPEYVAMVLRGIEKAEVNDEQN